MKITIIILLHKKSYSQKDLAYYCQKFTLQSFILRKSDILQYICKFKK